MNRPLFAATAALLLAAGCTAVEERIDRMALVERHAPRTTRIDTLASFTVGNGGFAFTADVTGLQSFPELYAHGVPLGTQSDWGWHSFANPENYRHEETLRDYDFGRGRTERYATHPDEGEFLEQNRVPLDELLDQVMSGRLRDGKTIALILKVRRFLDLEAQGGAAHG